MFVQQKKLTVLNLPADRLRRLFISTVDVQVALPGFPAQMASAYLVALTSGKGIQVLLGLFLVDSRCSVFFLPETGEVAPEKAEPILQDGLEFAESIGFVLADSDIHQIQSGKLDEFWRNLPICRKHEKPQSVDEQPPVVEKAAEPLEPAVVPEPAVAPEPAPEPSVSLDDRRKNCKESLGRFLASL